MSNEEMRYSMSKVMGRRSVLTIAFLISHFSFLISAAQTFTQRLQRQPAAGQGSVTIHQSDSIDRLVNSAVLSTKPAATPSAGQNSRPNGAAQSTQPTQGGTTATTAGTTPQGEHPEGAQHASRGTYKTTGYRVQAFSGGNSRADRQQAERISNSIKSQYPNVPVYVHFYSPHWICRVGNYRTYEEAHQMLVSLRNMGYSQAYIVRGKITVAY